MAKVYIKRKPSKLWEAIRDFEEGRELFVPVDNLIGDDGLRHLRLTNPHQVIDAFYNTTNEGELHIAIDEENTFVDSNDVRHELIETITDEEYFPDFMYELSNGDDPENMFFKYMDKVYQIKDICQFIRDFGVTAYTSRTSDVEDAIESKLLAEVKL